MATAFKKMLSKKNELQLIKAGDDSSSDKSSSSGSEEPLIAQKTDINEVTTDLT
jgi:hypothetical protein